MSFLLLEQLPDSAFPMHVCGAVDIVALIALLVRSLSWRGVVLVVDGHSSVSLCSSDY